MALPSGTDRPARMYAGDRGVDLSFDPAELLYHRFPGTVNSGMDAYIDQIAFYPDMSTNRSRYSEAGDVLYPSYFETHGVLSLRVSDVPGEIRSPGGPRYHWAAVHCPEPDNYAHTEVRTYRDGEFSRDLRITSAVVKKVFRSKLLSVVAVAIAPGSGVPEVAQER